MRFFDQGLIVACALLMGCGGGAGGGSSQPQSKVVSTNVFNLKAAYASFVSTPFQVNFSASLTKNGVTANGSGSVTQGATQTGTFEGAAAQKVVTTARGSITENGNTVPLDNSSTDYFDSNYNYLGTDGTSEYSVVDGIASFPTNIKVGNTGELYTVKKYSNSTKSTLTGTEKVSYLIEADTASTALVSIISVEKDNNSSVTSQDTTQYTICADNKLTPTKETWSDFSDGILGTVIY